MLITVTKINRNGWGLSLFSNIDPRSNNPVTATIAKYILSSLLDRAIFSAFFVGGIAFMVIIFYVSFTIQLRFDFDK